MNIGSNMKASLNKTAKMVLVSSTFQMGRSSKVISKMIWFGGKDAWWKKTGVALKEFGGKTN